MKKILAKAQCEGWTYLEQGLVCGNRMEFIKNEKRIGITLNPATYQLTNMSPSQMQVVMKADALYSGNDPIVAKIRNLSFEDQTNLTGVAREIFLLICEEE
ncbi:hypothetical protein LNN31_11325 [Acetobacterium wieringae]|jgi:hypothetical protein|uniref:Uncharacterized protein n=1 Tax=Acetobacterium wieringae TaxID=52694 RepID=A0A5D0WVQ7_9FIRM|nr:MULTISPECIES: hypothetical protein [Acetobacterium]OXS25514.1 MAG: hypothetical protein BI182_10080 [Acetobacterium sp. MES1]TYC88380.1 hypothetical protein FXB42_01840 [Acetobacterium wieringae]UYO61375.1 hypothetical protein LNN31_11325 [Acetobacterium wieringae]VUZ28729.1 Uncharacterised protein [Acetobacterium wieringae]